MLQLLSISDFDNMYALMEVSFPRDEYRPYAPQKALLAEHNYRVYGHFGENGRLLAFFAVWDLTELVFIEHFAVDPACRNQGLGSSLLQQLRTITGKPLCLEAELPDTPMAARRISFYERNGFVQNMYPYFQPALAEGQSPVPLRIMTNPDPLSPAEFQRFLELLKQVYKNL